MDEMSQCRPPEGAENHWFKHNDHGYRLYERISGTALGTFWMYRDFGGKSETLAAEGWTYHLPASPDDATERARLEQEVERLWEALRAIRDHYFEFIDNSDLDRRDAEMSAPSVLADINGIARAALTPGDAS